MGNNLNELLSIGLFGKVRRKLLLVFMLNPDKSFYMLELIRLIDCGRGAVQRELALLVEIGIIYRKPDGKHVYYSTNTQNLIYTELRSIISKTTGLIDLLKRDLEPYSDQIGVAFIYGKYAQGLAELDTPVALAVIGNITAKTIELATTDFAVETSRQVNIIVLNQSEWINKIRAVDECISSISNDENKIFLFGNELELFQISLLEKDLFTGIY